MQSPDTQQRPSEAPTVRWGHTPADDAKAQMVLDDEGTIQHVSDRVRDLLDLGAQSITGESFFSYVHPGRLNRVLHDLTKMTTGDKRRASWLIRLQTGLGPRQWFKVEAENRLDRDDQPGIVLRLFERGGGYENA